MLSVALVKESVTTFDFSGEPPWLVILSATILLLLFLWVAVKLLRITLWVLFFGVLVGGLGWAGWLLLH